MRWFARSVRNAVLWMLVDQRACQPTAGLIVTATTQRSATGARGWFAGRAVIRRRRLLTMLSILLIGPTELCAQVQIPWSDSVRAAQRSTQKPSAAPQAPQSPAPLPPVPQQVQPKQRNDQATHDATLVGVLILSAREWLDKGDLDRADEILRRIIEIQPDNQQVREYRRQLATSYAQLGQTDRADDILLELMTAGDPDGRLQKVRIQIAIAEEDWDKADRLLAAAGGAVDPQQIQKLRRQIAQWFISQDNLSRADQILSELTEEHDPDGEALMLRVRIAISEEDWDRTDRLLAAATDVVADTEQVRQLRLQLAKRFFDQGDGLRADRILAELAGEEDPKGELTFQRGRIALSDQRNDDAVSFFRQAFHADPSNLERPFWLGRALLINDQPRQALPWFHRVHRRDATYESVRLWIGTAHNQIGENPIHALRWLESFRPEEQDTRHQRWIQEAVAMSRLSLWGDAHARINSVIQQSGADGNAGKSAIRFRDQLWENFEEQRTSGFITITQQHDSNPAVLPDVSVFGVAAPTAEGDEATRIQGRLQHIALRKGNFDLILGGGYFHTAHYALSATDAVDLSLDATAVNRWWWNQNLLQAGATFAYDTYWFGHDPLTHRFGVSPYVSLTDEDLVTTSIRSTVRGSNFPGQGAVNGTPRDLDAALFSLGVNRSHQSHDGVWTFGYGYDWQRNNADGADFDFNLHIISASLGWVPNDDWSVQLGTSVSYRPYDGVDSIFGLQREDWQYQTSVTVTRQLTEKLRVFGLYSLDRNESNLTVNDYLRNTFEVGVTYIF